MRPDSEPENTAAFAACQDLSGMFVGRYSIRALLGSGGMGDVYLASDPRLKRLVAIKRLSRQLLSDPYNRQRFLKEAERASALNSPYIAAIFDVVEDRDELFLVMEYVEGETLRERLKAAFTTAEFLSIAI